MSSHYCKIIKDWKRESEQGFKKSDLASQCTHRYNMEEFLAIFLTPLLVIILCNNSTFLLLEIFNLSVRT